MPNHSRQQTTTPEKQKFLGPFFQRRTAFLLCFLSTSATAQSLHFTARLHGVPLFEVNYCLNLASTTYETRLTARTVGLAEFLVHGRVEGRAEGTFSETKLVPHIYTEHGRIAGEDHDLTIGWATGKPVIQRMVPPATAYRTVVADSDLAGAIDGLSAIALEVLVTSRTGACQGSALVFDGRQLRRLTTKTGGTDELPHTTRSVFAGPALRCDTQSIMLAGFLKGHDQARQARPYASHAWLAPLAAKSDRLPVRFVFDADALGDIVVDLDSVSDVHAASCSAR